MVLTIKEHGMRTHRLALGMRNGPIRLLIQVSITMERSKEKEFLDGLTAQFTKESS